MNRRDLVRRTRELVNLKRWHQRQLKRIDAEIAAQASGDGKPTKPLKTARRKVRDVVR